MKVRKNHLIIISLLCIAQLAHSQFSLDAEFRPRTEYRHGFGNLITESAEPGFATSTRARLNAGLKTDSYTFYLSLQDVMVWGENRQLLPDDTNDSFAIFEAWADLKLGNGFSTKIGRQTINLDDQRIMGSVGWAQQARNHDAALLKYKNNTFTADLGLAYNQDFDHPTGFKSIGNTYLTKGFFSYKTMKYLYLKNIWNNFSGSLLLLNNGFQNFKSDNMTADGISSLTTLGTHLNYQTGSFGFSANAFMQTGERQGAITVKGTHLLSFDLSYKASPKLGLGAGIESISGNDAETGATSAFFPLYGTNHKFNGFMDYFYVGNHANSIGLIDIHLSAKLTLTDSSKLVIKALNFSGEKALSSGEKALGTELDLVYTKKYNGYSISLGYSKMFSKDGMYELKRIAKDSAADQQNWAWAMLMIQPKFLK